MSGRNTEKVEQADKPHERKEARDGDLARDALSDMIGKRLAAPAGDKPAGPSREVKEDGTVVLSNAEGRITQAKHTDGTNYEYAYDQKGNLSVVRIGGKDGDADYWVKSKDGKWQSYDEYYGPGDKRNQPGNLQLNGGNWEVNQDGRMYHSSGQVTQVPEHHHKK